MDDGTERVARLRLVIKHNRGFDVRHVWSDGTVHWLDQPAAEKASTEFMAEFRKKSLLPWAAALSREYAVSQGGF
jgi:hypothetical protein